MVSRSDGEVRRVRPAGRCRACRKIIWFWQEQLMGMHVKCKRFMEGKR